MPLRCSEHFAASVVIANSRNIERTVGAALRVFIIMTCFTDRYHDILYS
jgi:hypothetical protein